MKISSPRYCVASQTELEGDAEALCHGLSQMQRWQHASCKIFPRVYLFLRGSTKGAHRQLPLQEASEWALRPKLCPWRNSIFISSSLQLHMTPPDLSGCPTQLQPTSFPSAGTCQETPRLPSGCRRSGGSGRRTASSPFWTLWFYYLTEQKVFLICHGPLWRGLVGAVALPSVPGWLGPVCCSSAASGIPPELSRHQAPPQQGHALSDWRRNHKTITEQPSRAHTWWLSLFWQQSSQNWAGNSVRSMPWDKGMPKVGIPVIEYVSHICAMHK